MIEDAALLRRYAQESSEEAFAEFVRRYFNLVYSAAVRRTNGDTHLAADVSQLVFASVARNSALLANHSMLEGWLYAATRNAALNALRAEKRRRARESKAHTMHESSSPEVAPDWRQVRPVLDAAIDELDTCDREAVLLRFFQSRPFAEVATKLRTSEDTARKRVERAVEKLHVLLVRRGVTSTTAALAVVLTTEGVTAAPANLVATTTTAAIAGAATGGGTLGILTLMSASKTITGIATIIAAVAIGSAIYEANVARDAVATVDSLKKERDSLLARLAHASTSESTNSRDAVGSAVTRPATAAEKPLPSDAIRAHPLAPGLTAADQLMDRGQTNPRDAIESVIQAKDKGDIAALAAHSLLKGDARKQAEALFNSLPPDTQAQYGSPEHLIATLMANDEPLAGMQVMAVKPTSTPDDLNVRIQVQYTDGRVREQNWPLENTTNGWQWLVPAPVVEHLARQLNGARPSPPPPSALSKTNPTR